MTVVEVVKPTPEGHWFFEWTCKAKGCGAGLRAVAEDVVCSHIEDLGVVYDVECPVCGTREKIKDPPPKIAEAAGRRRR